jgi:tetratricopeptide (TPR) repeat protein
MVLYDRGAFGEAGETLLRVPGPRIEAPIVTALSGLCAAGRGDFAGAETDLSAAARDLPQSVRLQRSLARTYQKLSRGEEAEKVYRGITVMQPDSARSWRELAEMCLRRRNLEGGLVAIERAVALDDDPANLSILANLKTQTGKGAEGRAILLRILESRPDDKGVLYDLGYSYDLDHQIVEAEKAYSRVIALEPDHGLALLCLANLHAGASRGKCKGCDEAYAAHPEYLDSRKAEDYLLRNLRADGGQNSWAAQSALAIALSLENRGRVIALLEELTAVQEEATPAALRLKELLARLKRAEG